MVWHGIPLAVARRRVPLRRHRGLRLVGDAIYDDVITTCLGCRPVGEPGVEAQLRIGQWCGQGPGVKAASKQFVGARSSSIRTDTTGPSHTHRLMSTGGPRVTVHSNGPVQCGVLPRLGPGTGVKGTAKGSWGKSARGFTGS